MMPAPLPPYQQQSMVALLPQQQIGGTTVVGMTDQQQRTQSQFLPLQSASIVPMTLSSNSQPLKAFLPVVPAQCGPPTVSLALMLDFAIHQTLHELHILTDLNLRKRPEDRKISVVQFAHSTRLIFVRLLAIVRWLKTYKKYEPLTSIRFLLDEQAARYIETADRLVEIARNELPNARLPFFQVPQAVDVLTIGTYPRLPQNIKDRFVSTPPLAGCEQRLTLRQLNRLLEFHLAQSAKQLSPYIEQISIRNGMAILLVPTEFELTLTRLGDDPQSKWCLLNIRILVDSPEIGQGQHLVHPLQVNFLHQMVQKRMENSEKPLLDAYSLLHCFCRSLQLDVLYCQAIQIGRMSTNYIHVEEYDVKECRLIISYWLTKDAKNRLGSKHRLILYGDKSNPYSDLKTKHRPASPELPKLDRSLSLQQLLNETVLFRCRERLMEAQKLLEQSKPKITGIIYSGHCLLSLTYPLTIIGDYHPDECVIVDVNTFFGTVSCRVDILGQLDEIRELGNQLNSVYPSISTITRLLNRLRILVIMERLQRALVGLQVRPLSDSQALPLVKKLDTLSPDRRIFQFIREDQFYLVVTFIPEEQLGIRIEFHLFSAIEGRLTLLDLDAEQIIRTAPLPRLYASASIGSQEIPTTGQRFHSFFEHYKKEKEIPTGKKGKFVTEPMQDD